MKRYYTFIDLFAGIGGFHIAFNNLNCKCVFAAEWNEKARQTYFTNFSNIKYEQLFDKKKQQTKNFATDITKVDKFSIPHHNILCAGFPCQPFSQAGFKKGFKDERGTLFFNIAEILKVKTPEAFFLENVRGLINHDNGNTFKVIKNTLEEIGYSFFYKIIKASDFNLPQHRPRLYMVGFRHDLKIKDFQFPSPLPLKKTMSDVFDGAIVNKKIGYTLRVGGKGSKLSDRRNWDGYIVDGIETRITPKHGKRMQGFPDDFIFPVSNSIAMKQLGNSVAIPVITAIGKKIVDIIANKNE